MSRAFVSENDGWYFCRSHQQSCKYADEYGRCMKRQCAYDTPAPGGTAGAGSAGPAQPLSPDKAG